MKVSEDSLGTECDGGSGASASRSFCLILCIDSLYDGPALFWAVRCGVLLNLGFIVRAGLSDWAISMCRPKMRENARGSDSLFFSLHRFCSTSNYETKLRSAKRHHKFIPASSSFLRQLHLASQLIPYMQPASYEHPFKWTVPIN